MASTGSPARRGALVLVALVWLAAAARAEELISPVKSGRWREAGEVLARWLRVQGLDRPAAGVFPREGAYEFRATPEAAPATLRFIDSGNERFWLGVRRADGGSHREVCAEPGSYWVSGPELGAGKLPGASPTAAALRRIRVDADFVRATYRRWERLPDQQRDGTTFHVLVLETMGRTLDVWWFDAATGVLVRRDGLNAENKLATRVQFSDFRDVDGALEPFAISDGDGPQRSTIRVLELANRVPVPRGQFAIDPAEAAAWAESEQVLRAYVRSCGGVQALARVVSRVTKARGENTAAGTKFTITMWQKAAPDRFLIETELAGVGRTWQGYDGKVAWDFSELKGYRTMRRDEAELFRRNGQLDLEDFPKKFPLRRLLGERDVAGRRTIAIELANLQGRAGTHHFDRETGRLLRVEAALSLGPDGSLPVTIDYSDFRTIDGVTLPFRSVITNPAIHVVTTVESIEQNVAIDEAIFRPRKDD